MAMKISILGGMSIDFSKFEPCTQKKEPVKMRVEVGQKVRFDPFREIKGFGAEDHRGELVTGTVVMVNAPHKWFSVEYGSPKQRTSFNFCEIGRAVTVCGD